MTDDLSQRTAEIMIRVHGAAYAQIAPDLTIQAMSDNLASLASDPEMVSIGASLSDCFWEYMGAEDAIQAVLAGDDDSHYIRRVGREQADGSWKYYAFGLLPYNADDLSEGLLLLIEDNTAGGRLEQSLTQDRNEMTLLKQKLAQYAEELEAANAELDAFSHTVAHDLRAPLTRIIGYVDLLLMTQSDNMTPEMKKSIESVKTFSFDMNDMIGSMLMLANLRDAEGVIDTVDMGHVVGKVAARLEGRIAERGVTLTIEEPIPPCFGYGPWLEEVFANFVENAVKYIGADNPDPRITVRGFAHHGVARFEVEDNGLGVPPDKQESLFEMFSRAHVHAAEGYGFGLSIVHRIITKLDGKLGVESTEGEGSIFYFTLNAAP